MAPRDTSSMSSGHNDAGKKITSLKLEFSKAADYDQLDSLFEPARKKKFDPNDFVLKRAEHAFRRAVNNGGAVFLRDQNDNAQSITVAYRYGHVDKSIPTSPHDYTEIGTTLSAIPGYRTALLMISALALKEWMTKPARITYAAEIDDDNPYSLRAFRDTLKWESIKNQRMSSIIYDYKDTTVANVKDRGKGNIPLDQAKSRWYQFGNKQIAVMAEILLSYMQQGGLMNKDKHLIPVDFSVLEEVGLTEKRLRAMSGGNVHRPSLWQMK